MRGAVISLLILSGALCVGPAAMADEVIIHRDHPDDVAPPPPFPPAHDEDAGPIEHHSPGCETKTITRENDQGDRKTVQKQHCD